MFTRKVFLCGFMLALTLSAASIVGLAQFNAACRIKGKLLDLHETGVSGAVVLAKNSASGEVLKVSSTDDGTFILTPLLPGLYQLTITKEGFRSSTLDGIKVEAANPAPLEVTLEPEVVKTAKEEGRISLRPEVFIQGRFALSPVRSSEARSETNFQLMRLEVGWSGKLTKRLGMGFEVQVQHAVYGQPRGMLDDAFVEYEFSDHLKVSAGQFVKPFGFDVQQSSSVRESPERGMFAGYFFPGERDRGIMVSGDLNALSHHALKNVSYSFAVFRGNLFFEKAEAQPNFVARVRKVFERPHLAIGLSMQRGKQFLPEGLSGKSSKNIYGFDAQYAIHRLELRAELVAGNTPSNFFPATSATATAPRTNAQSAGGSLLAVYTLTRTVNIYARYDQFNSDPQAGGNVRAFNFGYVRQVGKYSRVGFDYQIKNRESFNDDAANRRLQITWGMKF
jgi:hypothetical protein